MINKRFLTFKDYGSLIQNEDLFQVLNTKITTWDSLCISNKDILFSAEVEAQEEISSYLRGRYMVDEIFAPTQDFNLNDTYFGKNLVLYSENKYSTGTTYNTGSRFTYKEKIYVQSITGTTSGITDPSIYSGYTFLTENNSFYTAKLPIPEFNSTFNYKIGDIVWFQDHFYRAKQNVKGRTPAQSQNLEVRYGIPSAQGYLNFYNINNDITINNPLPSINTDYWELYTYTNSSINFTGNTYYFSGKTATDTNFWDKKDNRNPVIKLYLIDIILYHLFSRINPRNIPELRQVRYDGNSSLQTGGAIGWLKNIQKGKLNLDCPEIDPIQGYDLRFGSYPKNNNFF